MSRPTTATLSTTRMKAFAPAAVVGTIALSLTAAPAASAAPVAPADASGQAFRATGASAPRVASAVRVATAAETVRTHTVARGDTISGIAAKYKLRTADVLSWNGLKWSSIIKPGQKIRLAATNGTAAKAPTQSTAAKPAPATASTSYTVKRGDTLWAIAQSKKVSLSNLLSANKLSASSTIYPGQKLAIPGKGATAAPAPAVSQPAAAPKPAANTNTNTTTTGGSYTVKRGDTLWVIANNNKVSLANLLSANKISASTIIYPGQKLTIPGKGTSAAPAAPKPAANAPKPSTTTKPAANASSYTVKSGDSLWAIAQSKKVSLSNLLAANKLSSSSTIYPGQKLTIPAPGSTVTPAPASTGSSTPAPAPASAPSNTTGTTYTVAAGDTISSIANKAGISTATLLAANGMSSGSIIYPGQKLTIPTQRVAGLDAEQARNAEIIIEVGRSRGVSDRGIAIALATAMVESWLRNLDWGDRDSLGLFQQRPSQGWGTAAQVRDPARSAATFFGGPSDPNGSKTRGLLDIRGWESMGFTQAAQAVQISAYPNRYGQWEKQAYAWLAALG